MADCAPFRPNQKRLSFFCFSGNKQNRKTNLLPRIHVQNTLMSFPSFPHISFPLFYLKKSQSSWEPSSLCDSLSDLSSMGSSYSLFNPDLDGLTNTPSKPGLGDLPESCVASIMGYLEPTEICTLARLNRAFRGASWADFVWESKLPSNYGDLVREILGDSLGNLSKREIYARLCRPNSFDGGTKKVRLDKSTGGVCLSVSSKGLAITGIDDRRYWNHIPTEESRFQTVAYLQQIWWFEVDGEVEFPFPPGAYSLYFRLLLGRVSKRFGRRVCNTERIHGWDKKPVRFQLHTSDGQSASSQCFLTEPGRWNIYKVGDFVVENASASTKIKFSMTQIDCTHTKGGLCLDSVMIMPK